MVRYAQDDRRRAKDDRHIASMGEAGSQSLDKLITDADGCSGSLERRAGRSFDSTAVGYWIRHGRQKLKIDFQRGQNCRGPFPCRRVQHSGPGSVGPIRDNAAGVAPPEVILWKQHV